MLGQFTIENAQQKFEEQMTWLEETLNNSTAEWLIVMGHYPLFSVGQDHGDSDEMQNALLKLFEVYKVDVYLSGHDHTLQHLSNKDIEYFVTGTGSKQSGGFRDFSRTKASKVQFTSLSPGFSLHTITKTQMTSSFIDTSGNEIYKYSQNAKRFFPSKKPIRIDPSPDPPSKTSEIVLGVIACLVVATIAGVFIWKKNKDRQRRSFQKTQLDEFEPSDDSDTNL